MKETDLHKEIMKLFKKLGIFYIRSRTDKRTTQRKGIPDFILAIHGIAIALEVKTENNKLSKDQIDVADEMMASPNKWMWFEVRSIDDVSEILSFGFDI